MELPRPLEDVLYGIVVGEIEIPEGDFDLTIETTRNNWIYPASSFDLRVWCDLYRASAGEAGDVFDYNERFKGFFPMAESDYRLSENDLHAFALVGNFTAPELTNTPPITRCLERTPFTSRLNATHVLPNTYTFEDLSIYSLKEIVRK